MDWDTDIEPQKGVKFFGLTARLFSGRSFKRDQTFCIKATNTAGIVAINGSKLGIKFKIPATRAQV